MIEVGKGTKRMLVVDGNGIPLALSISRASKAEVKLAQETLVCGYRGGGGVRGRG